MKISKALTLSLISAALISLAGCSASPATEDASAAGTPHADNPYETLGIETTAGTQLNRFASIEEYKAAGTTASVRADSIREKTPVTGNSLFIIYGVDLKSEEFKKGDFIFAGDIDQSGRSDYDYDGLTLPITGAVIAFRKDVVDMLAPKAEKYVIAGREATRADFDSIPATSLQCITIHGSTLLVMNKLYDEIETNPDVQKATEDEGRLMRLFLTGTDAFAE